MPGEAGALPTLSHGRTDAAVTPTTVPEDGRAAPAISPAWQAAFVFLGIAAVLFLVGGLSLAHLPYTGTNQRANPFPGRPWLGTWAHWDAGWYRDIADLGYWAYPKTGTGPMAFFPSYPLAMRAAKVITGSSLLAGVIVTVAAGALTAGLFAVWLRDRMSPRAAWTALLLFLLYPFAFYLYGAVYADALFIAAAIGSFLLLERGHPWLSGMVGAIATAARPVGFVLVIALVLRVIELRGGWRRVPWRDAGVLLASAGVGAFVLYGWAKWGEPLAFVEAQKGWNQEPGPRTWLKVQFFVDVRDFRSPPAWAVFVSHPILTAAALALVPRVVRRYGWSYGSFALLGLCISAFSTKNFFGMSRYVLSAFPVFAVAGELLADRVRLRLATFVGSGGALAAATSFFARGHYLS